MTEEDAELITAILKNYREGSPVSTPQTVANLAVAYEQAFYRLQRPVAPASLGGILIWAATGSIVGGAIMYWIAG